MMHQEQLENKMEAKPSSPELKYIMFENRSNNCWLDASMALVAHNKAIKIIAGCSPNSKLHEIISTYAEAVSVLNDANQNVELRVETAKEKLQKMQIRTLQYLQPMLKCQNGEPDSAFCALLNLIYENKSIKKNLSITWLWNKKCLVCNTSKLTQSVKPIITLSKVNYFLPDCPTSIYLCSCKTEQEMKLVYKELPPCLFFHFENGAGKGESPPLIFSIQDRKYQLTGVITLEKGVESTVNHFITWIRDPKSNKWLECNDLNTDLISFNLEHPEINLNDVYMYVYESFDKIGKMAIEISTDYLQAQDPENTNFELIDLSNESEDVKPIVMSPSAQDTKNLEEFVENLPVHSSSKPLLMETPKKEKVTTKFDCTSISQKVTKEIEHLTNCSNLTQSQQISKADQENHSISCSNILDEKDGKESSKVDEEIKPKIDYSKAIIKNVRFNQETRPIFLDSGYKYKSTVTSVSSLAQLRKIERELFLREMKICTKDDVSKENTQMIYSGENQSVHSKENNCQKIIDSSLPDPKKEDLQVNSLDVSKMQSLKPDASKELDNLKYDISPDKKSLIVSEKKNGSSVVGISSPIREVAEEKSIINKLSDSCSEENQNGLMISNTSANVMNLPEMYKQIDVFPKGIDKTKTLQNNECEIQIKEKTLTNQSDVSVETSNSSSIKSNKSRKRKNSSQQDMPENSVGKHITPSKVGKKLQRINTDKNESNELSESQVKMQRKSFRKACKNKKYISESFEEYPLKPSEIEGRQNQTVNIIRVTAVDNGVPDKKKSMLKNQKQLPEKAVKKSRKSLNERKLEELVDDVVERSFAAFLEQVLHKHKIEL